MAFRHNLKAALDGSPRSREEIAQEAGTTSETLARFVSGAQRNPGLALLTRIAAAAGTTVVYLVGGEEHAFSPEDYDEVERHAKWLLKRGRKVEAAANAEILVTPRAKKRPRRAETPEAPVAILADAPGEVEIPRRYRERDAEIVARALDDSMSGAGINAGDLLYAVGGADAKGKFVVCRVAREAFVKRISISGKLVTLLSENPRYAPLQASLKDVEILGVVIGRSGDVGDLT
jgi:transcriptional regulator with XRE-family HTH domain